jgi:hypothetical protein
MKNSKEKQNFELTNDFEKNELLKELLLKI